MTALLLYHGVVGLLFAWASVVFVRQTWALRSVPNTPMWFVVGLSTIFVCCLTAAFVCSVVVPWVLPVLLLLCFVTKLCLHPYL